MFYVSNIEGSGKKTQVFVTDTADGVTEPISLQDAEDLMNRGISIEGVYRHYKYNDPKQPTNNARVMCSGNFLKTMRLSAGDVVSIQQIDRSSYNGIYLGFATFENKKSSGFLFYSTENFSLPFAYTTSVKNVYLIKCRHLLETNSLYTIVNKVVSGSGDVVAMQKAFREAGGLSILSSDIRVKDKMLIVGV